MPEENKIKEQNDKLKIGIVGLFIFLIYLLLVFFLPLPAADPAEVPVWWLRQWEPASAPYKFAVESRIAIGQALIGFAALSTFIQLIQYTNITREIETSVTRVIAGSAPIISKFNREAKKEFVKNSLISALGNKIGIATYNHVIPMMDQTVGFRRDFKYTVTLLEKENYPKANGKNDEFISMFSSDRYRWIHEDLSYRRYIPSTESYAKGPFSIAIAFDKHTLENMMSDQELFCRLLVELEPAEIKQIEVATPAQIEIFVAEVCKLKAIEMNEGDGKKLTTTAVLIPAKSSISTAIQPLPSILVQIAPFEDTAGTSTLQIGFQYPYSRSATHFTFSHPQPVEAPDMYFHPSKDVEDISWVSYMSSVAKSVTHHKPKASGEYHIEVAKDVWVFPTSGITFIWKNKL